MDLHTCSLSGKVSELAAHSAWQKPLGGCAKAKLPRALLSIAGVDSGFWSVTEEIIFSSKQKYGY